MAPLELRLVFLLLNRGTPLILSSTLSANAVQVDDSLLFVWEHCVAYYDFVLYAEKAASSLSKRHVAQACNIGETLKNSCVIVDRRYPALSVNNKSSSHENLNTKYRDCNNQNFHYVNISVLINFSKKTSVFTLITISSP